MFFLARKRTKAEASKRLREKREELGDEASAVARASFALGQGLIYLDPLNRLADATIVLPLDMVAIPAYQAYMIDGSPSMQIYIRAGETIVPTGGNVRDVQEALDEVDANVRNIPGQRPAQGGVPMGVEAQTRVPSAYQKRYKKEFSRLKPRYVKQNGEWKKDGFKRCVKAAHAAARKK